MRFDQFISQFNYVRLTENFAYRPNRFFDLEAHYSYIYYKPQGSDQFINTNRLEFEMNPSLFLFRTEVVWRNRIEVIKKEDISQIQTLFRHRIKVFFPLQNDYLTSFNISDEIYFDLNRCQFTQNRFTPFELTLKFPSGLLLDVFCMIRNDLSLSSDKWYRNVVLGSEFEF